MENEKKKPKFIGEWREKKTLSFMANVGVGQAGRARVVRECGLVDGKSHSMEGCTQKPQYLVF